MQFEIGDYIVFTDEFRKINGEYLKYPKHLNAVFIINDIMSEYFIVSLDGVKNEGGYRKKHFRLASKKEIKRNMIKRKFII